jgi:O-antigen/teichoic acid export membrane protein
VSDEPTGELHESETLPRQLAADARAAARATAVMVTGRLIVALLGWAGTVIVARSLASEEWGQFNFVFALLFLMAIFTDLGVGRIVLSALIDDDPDEVARTASSFVALRTVLGGIGYLIAVGYVVVLGYPGQVIAATTIAGLVVVFATPGHALSVLFQSRHRLTLAAVAECLGQVIQLALTVLAALFAPLLLVFVLAPVAKELVALTIKIFGIQRRSLQLRLSRRIEIRRWGHLLKDAIPLAIGFALTVAMLKISVLMLSRMDSFEAVGFYSIGNKFSDMMDTLSVAAAGPVSTLLVAAWPDKSEEFRERSRSAATAFAVAGAVAVAAFWPSAEHIIGLLFGERFVASASAARLQVLGAAMTALIVLGMYMLAAAGKQRYYPIVAFLGLALNVAANMVLIPRLSFNGAAIAAVVTLSVTAVMLWIMIARTMPIQGLLPLWRILSMAAVTAGIVAVAVQLENRFPWPLVSAAATAAVLVMAYMFRLKAERGRDRGKYDVSHCSLGAGITQKDEEGG